MCSEACLCTATADGISKFRLVVESCRKSPKLDASVTSESFGTNWLGDSEPDVNLDIASLLSSRAMCRLREKKKKVSFFIPSTTHIFPVTGIHNAFASLCASEGFAPSCLKIYLRDARLCVSVLFLQAVSREVLQPRFANTKLLATSKHHRAKLPLSRELSEIFEALPRLCEITWRFQTTRAFTVLNLRRRRPAAFWNIEKCSNPSLSVFPFIYLYADIYLVCYWLDSLYIFKRSRQLFWDLTFVFVCFNMSDFQQHSGESRMLIVSECM